MKEILEKKTENLCIVPVVMNKHHISNAVKNYLVENPEVIENVIKKFVHTLISQELSSFNFNTEKIETTIKKSIKDVNLLSRNLEKHIEQTLNNKNNFLKREIQERIDKELNQKCKDLKVAVRIEGL